ncbi:hypothetical protein [Tateyamaria sp.]|uniref:hypothetical protein n=1 Tax=Tateyamaria sp. TaxID=1929288 RepID=UPI003B210443
MNPLPKLSFTWKQRAPFVQRMAICHPAVYGVSLAAFYALQPVACLGDKFIKPE